MVLTVHTNASYLLKPNCKSWAAGHFFFTYHNNAPIVTLSTLIKHVLASASKAKLTALFYSCKQANPLRITLAEMGHQQLCTIVTTDNITAKGLTFSTMQPEASESMDMQWLWFKCWSAQNQFHYQWQQSADNCASCYSKHHPRSYHQKIQDIISAPSQVALYICPFFFFVFLILTHLDIRIGPSMSFPCEGVLEHTPIREQQDPINMEASPSHLGKWHGTTDDLKK